MTPRPPVRATVPGLRQRPRGTGWRVWWEPNGPARALGFKAVELDADRPTWSERRAAELNAQVAAARRRRDRAPSATGRTVAELIADYTASPDFQRKAAKTRESYAAQLRLIDRKWGTALVADFTKAVMKAWHETLLDQGSDRRAEYLIRMMSILFSRAEMLGWRPDGSNPCFRLKIATPRPRGTVASWAQIDALIAAADALGLGSIGDAVLVSALQGQRQTDLRLARLGDFARIPVLHEGETAPRPRWVWALTRSKRGNHGAMLLHDEVEARLEPRLQQLADAPDTAAALPLLPDPATGDAWPEVRFQDAWRKIRAQAAKALPTCAALQFRDLRRTFGVLARSGGATRDDTGDVLGNSIAVNPRLAATYTPATVLTASRAVLAITRPKEDDRRKA